MKRRLIALILAGTLSFSIGSPAFASQMGKTGKNQGKIQKEVYDTSKDPQKSFMPQLLDGSGDVLAASGKLWSAECDIYNPFFGYVKCKAMSSSTDSGSPWPIDYIYAKARAYKNGVLYASAVDYTENASYAGALADTENEGVGYEGYGNHKFEELGYQSWYPETYDNEL